MTDLGDALTAIAKYLGKPRNGNKEISPKLCHCTYRGFTDRQVIIPFRTCGESNKGNVQPEDVEITAAEMHWSPISKGSTHLLEILLWLWKCAFVPLRKLPGIWKKTDVASLNDRFLLNEGLSSAQPAESDEITHVQQFAASLRGIALAVALLAGVTLVWVMVSAGLASTAYYTFRLARELNILWNPEEQLWYNLSACFSACPALLVAYAAAGYRDAISIRNYNPITIASDAPEKPRRILGLATTSWTLICWVLGCSLAVAAVLATYSSPSFLKIYDAIHYAPTKIGGWYLPLILIWISVTIWPTLFNQRGRGLTGQLGRLWSVVFAVLLILGSLISLKYALSSVLICLLISVNYFFWLIGYLVDWLGDVKSFVSSEEGVHAGEARKQVMRFAQDKLELAFGYAVRPPESWAAVDIDKYDRPL